MSCWSHTNQYSLFRAMPIVAMSFSYEVPLVLSLLGVVLFTQPLSLQGMVFWQKEYDIWNKLSERVQEFCEDSKLLTVRFQMLLVTSSIVRIECTCGAAERCFSEIDKYCLAGVLDVPDEFDFDPFGCGTDDVESNVAEAEARAADKELRSGRFGDGDDG